MEKMNSLGLNVQFFFNMQISHIKKKQWTKEEREFSLSLFYRSPKTYMFLRDHKKFSLPCVSLIRRWVNEIDLEPGSISPKLQEILSVRAKTLSALERECVLIWDEISIKKWLEYNS